LFLQQSERGYLIIVIGSPAEMQRICYYKEMIVVIIAGGSGSRLWPLSTPTFPKQLLKVNGDSRSLLQNTYDRARKLTDEIYVVPEASHVDIAREQLSELDEDHIIIEPARRGTAHCIVQALDYISKNHHDHDEPIAFLHSDHYIRDVKGFTQSFKVAGKASAKHGRVVLVGVEPDEPATGFGYIQKDTLLDENQFVYTVDSFKEKPDFETAKKYLRSGNYLWNCGYFVGSVNTFKSAMEEAPDLLANFQKLQDATPANYEETYLSFESNTIDYALMEKVSNLLVVPANFDWMDLGSFNDMYKAADRDIIGNNVQGLVEIEEVENSFIQNQEDKPVVVIGLDNVVVINTPDGILVARKDLSQKVGDVSKRFKK
jgi:mannose-1-phosphate guanylyltransferase